jgi:hypothetical protein
MDVSRFQRKFGEVDELLLHLKGVVLVRGLLEERGVTPAEIGELDAEIERLRDRLAGLMQRGGGAHSAAA